jgi:hypothetical protein
VDVKPVGLFAVGGALPVLPTSVPLTITHLGPSRIRVRRDANPDAPPITLPEPLRLTQEQLLSLVSADSKGKPGKPLLDFGTTMANAAIDASVNPATITHEQLTKRLFAELAGNLPVRLHALLDPVIGQAEIGRIIQFWAEDLFFYPFQVPAGLANTDDGRTKLRNAVITEYGLRLDSKARPGGDTAPPSGLANNLRARLAPSLTAGHAQALKQWLPRVAKWGGARIEEERDPHLRALGYMTLVQDFPQESGVFNLVADVGALAGGILGGVSGGLLAASPARTIEAPTQALQYRPFENRGVEGDWLLHLGGLGGALGVANPAGLIDLLFEITVRGCYDENLAASVRANQSQLGQQLDRAKAVAASANKALRMPGSLPELLLGATGLRTIRYSARAHRDNLLRHALAALEAVKDKNPPDIDGLPLLADAKLLGFNEPLKALTGQGLKTFGLKFQNDDQPGTLGLLHSLIAIKPDDLGLPLGSGASAVGTIESLGVAVIPAGKRLADGSDRKLLKAVKIDGPLKSLLPQFDDTQPNPNLAKDLAGSLFLTETAPQTPILLGDLFGGTGPAGITLDFDDAIDGQYVYDVIFSLSIRSPVPQLVASPAAV